MCLTVATLSLAQPAAAQQSIYGALAQDGRFSTFVRLVDKAGLSHLLANNQLFTVFAPTNDAFARLGWSELASLEADYGRLRQTVLYHIAKGRVAVPAATADTALGVPLTVSTSHGVSKVNRNAVIISAEMMAWNGSLYAIDHVLDPNETAPPDEQRTGGYDGIAPPGNGQTGSGDLVQNKLRLEQVADGFREVTTITHAGDSRLFIVERAGKIYTLWPNGERSLFIDLSSKVLSDAGERGLLGLAFHPNFAENGYFFASYTQKWPVGRSVIERYRVRYDAANVGDPNSAVPVLYVPQPQDSHNAGDVKFGPDGYLYFAIGDGTTSQYPDLGNNAQSLHSLLGKIGRIDIDGNSGITPYCHGGVANPIYTIPSDNPYAWRDGCGEIWASGLRNPWRFSFDRNTQDMYIGEVGMWHWDEVNFIPAGSNGGQNFGWRCKEGPVVRFNESCNWQAGYVSALHNVNHKEGNVRCRAITGGFVYRGWNHANRRGQYIFADSCNGDVFALHLNGYNKWRETLFHQDNFFPATLGEDSKGELYTTDFFSGTVYRLAFPAN